MKDLMAIRPIMVELMGIETGNTGLGDARAWSGEIREFYSLTDSPSLQQLKTVIAPKKPSHLHIADFIACLPQRSTQERRTCAIG
jgi:hypothetical protein